MFSHGLEECHEGLDFMIDDLTGLYTTIDPNQDGWLEELEANVKSMPSGLGNVFSLILPVGTELAEDEDDDSSSYTSSTDSDSTSVTCLYDLIFEHAKSLDWDTCDIHDDKALDSVTRILFLALLKHTGLIGHVTEVSFSELRHNAKLHEVFALVFHVRSRLVVKKQDELLKKQFPPSSPPMREHPPDSHPGTLPFLIDDSPVQQLRSSPVHASVFGSAKRDGDSSADYKILCRRIIRKSLLLFLCVKSAANFTPPRKESTDADSDNGSCESGDVEESFFVYDEDAESVISAKSSETFQSPESRHQNNFGSKSTALVRKLGRNVLRFTAFELISSKRDWFADSLLSTSKGFNSKPQVILSAMRKHEQRARIRIEALEQVLSLILAEGREDETASSESTKEINSKCLSSVHEFFIAGCFQLGISAENCPDRSSAGKFLNNFDLHVTFCHYLDGIQSAPYQMQKDVVNSVHEIMRWIISRLQLQMFADPRLVDETGLDDEGKSFHSCEKSDEVRLLKLFTLSGRFNANDVTLMVTSGLLPVLENFCNSSNPGLSESGPASATLVTKTGATYPNYVSMASLRLLHMIAGATA